MSTLHHNVKDLRGKTFGRWTVISYAGRSYWLCRCECGTVKTVFTGSFGRSNSCGCYCSEATTARKTTHNQSKSAEYKTWAGIKRRCLNKNEKCYSRYGAVGITICKRWSDSFSAFLEDMGKKPSPEYTVERIKNHLGYQPGNCRWATADEQSRNKTTSRFIEFRGERKVLMEWAKEFGLHHSLIQYRIRAGWSIERALTTPARKCKPRHS